MKLECQRGNRLIFSDLDFEIGSGELLTLTGPNGSGKTSLLRIVAGLLNQTSGTISLESGNGEHDLPARVHYLGHLNALKPALSVRDNLAFWSNFSPNAEGSPEDALAAVGLNHVIDLPAGVLSAGQARRTAFARLLMYNRPVWLLDEPTTSLDIEAADIVRDVMQRHLANNGIIVAATHADLSVDSKRFATSNLDMTGFKVRVPGTPVDIIA